MKKFIYPHSYIEQSSHTIFPCSLTKTINPKKPKNIPWLPLAPPAIIWCFGYEFLSSRTLASASL
jgi:hypothetical protein